MGEGKEHPWNAFWVVCKYPPGLAYISLTVGADLVALYLLSLVDSSRAWARVVLYYGRSALMFYITHFWFITFFGLLLWCIGHIWGVPLPAVIPFYLAVLFIEYFIVKAFGAFKSRQDINSLWRLL